jgi:hypothetical protein
MYHYLYVEHEAEGGGLLESDLKGSLSKVDFERMICFECNNKCS